MMYLATIKTRFNTIRLQIENPNDPEFLEVLEQPYIEEVRIEQKVEQLKKERDEALSHVVGTAYYWQVAKEKNEEMKRLLEKK